MRPVSLFRAHQVGYSWIIRYEACPTSFSEVLSLLHHEVFRPQIFLTVCFEVPYCKAYTGRASVPLGDVGKEEEERETETSELARGLPSYSGQDPKGGGLSFAFVRRRGWRLLGGGGGGGGLNEPSLEVLPISVWSLTSRGAAPPPTVLDEVRGNRDRSEAAGDEDSLLSHTELTTEAVSSILRYSYLRRVGALPVEEALALLL